MPGDHALLSASSSKRWMECPPSARIEEEYPEEQSSYAAEGSLAHELGEALIRLRFATDDKELDLRMTRIRGICEQELWQPEMNEYMDLYAQFVSERLNSLHDPVLFLEQKLDYSYYASEGFGTGDVVIISDGILEIIDLKYGKGVPISAENNSQMKLYALGAYELFNAIYEIDMVRMTIYQPRIDNISTSEVSVSELIKWGIHEVIPAANLAWEGKGNFKSGEHCRFCKARFKCRARAEENLKMARTEFGNPTMLMDFEIEDILAQASNLKDWIRDVERYAFEQAIAGKQWSRYKLVEGRSYRKYSDPHDAAFILLTNGYSEDMIYSREIRSIADMEKLLGKKRFKELLSDYVVKPPGSPTLVPIEDKRKSIGYGSAAEDFKD